MVTTILLLQFKTALKKDLAKAMRLLAGMYLSIHANFFKMPYMVKYCFYNK